MKKILAAALATLMALSLTACSDNGDSSSDAAVEVTALAQEMVEATSWNDEVIQMNEDIIPNYYTLPDNVEEYVVYLCPTGATVEEVAVFKISDDKTDALETAVSNHIQARIAEYESYRPDEVKKLNAAAVKQNGSYLAVIIADDTAPAAEKFDAAFGK